MFEVETGTLLRLDAHPADGYDFNSWSGDCAGGPDSPSCDVMVDSSTNVFAGFKQRSTGNTAPQAAISGDRSGPINAVLQLSGAESSDADGDPLTYTWAIDSQPALGSAVLGSPTEVRTTFVGLVAGIYVVSLIVDDGQESSDPATFAL